jgi:hypothetical protein
MKIAAQQSAFVRNKPKSGGSIYKDKFGPKRLQELFCNTEDLASSKDDINVLSPKMTLLGFISKSTSSWLDRVFI